MEIGQLKHLQAVLAEGNFARAARRCGISQQALSASIARLEKQLQVRLFERGRSGATPTVEADAFAPFVELAFAQLRQGEIAMAEAANGGIGEVSFGVGQLFSGRIVPDAIARMSREHPGVRLTVTEDYASRLAQDVVEGKLDFFVGAPIEKMVTSSSLRIKPLFEINDRIVCRRTHPLASESIATLEQTLRFPWLFPSPPSAEQRAIDKACGEAGLRPPSVFVYSDTIAAAQAMLARADCLIVGQADILAPLVDAGILTTLNVDFELPQRTGCLGFRSDGVLRPCVRKMIAMIEENVGRFLQQTI